MTGRERHLLLVAAQECSLRGLLQGAKWAAELAAELPVMDSDGDLPVVQYTADFVAELGSFTMAKAYFDLHEYDRAAHALRSCSSQRAVFLRCYSQYLAGEKRKENERVDLLGPAGDDVVTTNPHLETIRSELSLLSSQGKLDGYGHYLLGVVLKELDLTAQAAGSFVTAASQEPLHWGAWLELASLCVDEGDLPRVEELDLPQESFVFAFFAAHLSLELQHNEAALTQYKGLAESFPSPYVTSQVAVAYYNLQKFAESQRMFAELRKQDPYRLENIDAYSNILYVMEMASELSHLAHQATEVDRYRAETCCVIGNYYSLKNRHDKAVVYFRRALRLNRRYLSAWTLMGHEYVELKNTAAAIEAYRNAVDINPRDYRAWYGLGQTYELLYMPLYSLYYYRRAQRLRPNDPRMLSALAQMYKTLLQWNDAAKCYERTVENNPDDRAAYNELGVLYKDLMEPTDHKKAALYFGKLVDLELEANSGNVESESALKACLFLGHFYADHDDLASASRYNSILMKYGGKYKEKGKDLQVKIQTLGHA